MMPPDDPSGFAAAHRQLLSDPSIQFQMSPYEPPRPPAWLEPLVDFLRAAFKTLSSPIARYLLWALLAALAATLLFLLIRYLAGESWPWKKRQKTSESDDAWRPVENVARALLHDADALAAEGRFDEAAHLLLFRSIDDIDMHRPQLVQPALTSRDIAAAADIPASPRESFHAIVMMVEKSLFGGQRLAEADWTQCRSAYERFAFAEAWK
jgi:hypothetical protein